MRLILSIAALTLCVSQATAADFTMNYKWCSGSPNIQVSNVPKGTSELEFKMVDLNKPSFNHGGGKIKYTNQKNIACGEFTSTFTGPSPPPPQVHDYEITATAKDKDGNVLGTAKAVKKFPE